MSLQLHIFMVFTEVVYRASTAPGGTVSKRLAGNINHRLLAQNSTYDSVGFPNDSRVGS